MVGGRVEHQRVGVAHHHTGYHTAHFLATGQHRRFLSTSSPENSILPRNPFEIYLAGVVAELCEPVHKVEIGIEEIGVVGRQVGVGDGLPPLVSAGIGLAVAVDNLEKRCHSTRVVARGKPPCRLSLSGN